MVRGIVASAAGVPVHHLYGPVLTPTPTLSQNLYSDCLYTPAGQNAVAVYIAAL